MENEKTKICAEGAVKTCLKAINSRAPNAWRIFHPVDLTISAPHGPDWFVLFLHLCENFGVTRRRFEAQQSCS